MPPPPKKSPATFAAIQSARFVMSLHNLASQHPEFVRWLLEFKFPGDKIRANYFGFPLMLDEGSVSLSTLLFGAGVALTGKALVLRRSDKGVHFMLTDFKIELAGQQRPDWEELSRAPTSIEDAQVRMDRFIRDLSGADPSTIDQLLAASRRASPSIGRLLGADETRPMRITVQQFLLGIVSATLGAASTSLTVDQAGIMGLVSHYPKSHESPSCVA